MGSRIGVDIITLERMRDAVRITGALFLDRVFTTREQALARDRSDPVAYFATRFAAKEAIFKALRDSTGFVYTEIEIEEGLSGEPVAHLHGRLAERADHVTVSVAYDGDAAIAVALLSDGGSRGSDERNTDRDLRPIPTVTGGPRIDERRPPHVAAGASDGHGTNGHLRASDL